MTSTHTHTHINALTSYSNNIHNHSILLLEKGSQSFGELMLVNVLHWDTHLSTYIIHKHVIVINRTWQNIKWSNATSLLNEVMLLNLQSVYCVDHDPVHVIKFRSGLIISLFLTKRAYVRTSYYSICLTSTSTWNIWHPDRIRLWIFVMEFPGSSWYC